MIELGGNIKLKGFSELDVASLVVVKKIVGNYTRELSKIHNDFTELLLELSSKGSSDFNINANFSKKSGNLTSSANGSNLFFTLSAALGNISKK
ncbi:MAG: hypothetical protein Q8Q42_01440 [Nanoarchaeota archaeon]|nr:hypothetical protein [Nanoarchaeota archaeon]